jgi:hypothetical protein
MLMHYQTPHLNCIDSYYVVPFNIYNTKCKLTLKAPGISITLFLYRTISLYKILP